MRKGLFLIAAAMFVLIGGCAASEIKNTPDTAGTSIQNTTPVEATVQESDMLDMSIKSNGIVQGVIDPKYGANGDLDAKGIPAVSPPVAIMDAPSNTACFALYMDDPDSEPIAGYNWVHWMAANFSQTELPEDFSRNAGGAAVQGQNDFGETGYGGPMPPDEDHTYVITVYALDEDLPLQDGFTKKEFEQAISGHILSSATIEGLYRK